MNEEFVALKLEIDIDSQSAQVLDGQSKICNWLYNHLLAIGSELKKHFIGTKDPSAAKTVYTKRGLRNLIPSIKLKHQFLKVVHSSPLKNAALRLAEAIQAYQKSRQGKRKGAKTGWPKFRSWKKKWFSLFYDEPGKGFKVEDGKLILSLGMEQDRKQRFLALVLKEANLLKERNIRNLRITCELGKYYAIFLVCKVLPEEKTINKVLALDPNHKNFAYGVDTDQEAMEIAAPLWLKNYDKRLDELTSKRARCNKKSKTISILDEKGNPTGREFHKPSKRWSHYDSVIKKTLNKRREQTKTFMYTAAHVLFKKYDCVAIGDYTPHGEGDNSSMRRSMNNRSLIGRWKGVLSWVANKSGKTFMEFDEKNTTRECNHCKKIESGGIPVSVRQWQCSGCQTIHIRDENAAINGLGKVLRDLSKKYKGENPLIVSSSDPVFVKKRWAWCVFPSGVQKTLRGETAIMIAAPGN
jgi:putative transposase